MQIQGAVPMIKAEQTASWQPSLDLTFVSWANKKHCGAYFYGDAKY